MKIVKKGWASYIFKIENSKLIFKSKTIAKIIVTINYFIKLIKTLVMVLFLSALITTLRKSKGHERIRLCV